MEKIEDCDFILKMSIVGESAVGKTNLLKTYSTGQFNQNEVPTVGIDFFTETLNLEEKIIRI